MWRRLLGGSAYWHKGWALVQALLKVKATRGAKHFTKHRGAGPLFKRGAGVSYFVARVVEAVLLTNCFINKFKYPLRCNRRSEKGYP